MTLRDFRIPGPLAALAFLAAAFALYGGTLGNPLVFDDAGLSEQAIATQYSKAAAHLQLRWLADATYWWVYALAGYQLEWQRVVNILLHATTATVLFGFLARLFEAVAADKSCRALAFLGAAWFLVHPVSVYGVAYLAERSIILATLFSLIALWFLLEGLLRGHWIAHAGTAIAYYLAVSSKEHAVMMPAAGAALAILVRGASLGTLRRVAIPYVMFAAIGLFVVLRQKQIIGSVYEPLVDQALTLRPRTGLTGAGRAELHFAYPLSVMNQATLFFRYLATWIFPWPGWMSIDVRTPFPGSLASPFYVAGFAAWLAYAAGAAWLLVKRGRLGLLGFGMIYPWLLALTEMAAVRVQEPFVLYRSYLWMSGLPALLPAVVSMVLGSLAPRWRNGLLTLVLAVLIVPTLDRLATFSSSFRIWDDAARKNEGSDAYYVERAYLNRGLMHLDAGRFKAAQEDFERALQRNPRSPEAYVGRGSLRLREQRMPEALADFTRAVELDPGYGTAFDKRCMAKTALSGPQDGLADCEQAVKVDPDNHDAWTNLGAVYHALGRPKDAAASFERAMDIYPNYGPAHYNYGILLLESGRRDALVRRHIVIGCKAGIADACRLLESSR